MTTAARNTLKLALIATGALLVNGQALALNYYELEVYPYATAAKGELELENATTHTRRGPKGAGDDEATTDGRMRSSFEATYGVTDRLEVSAYADFLRDPGEGWSFGGQRYHVRTRFFEKGELPVDLGAYVELEMPKHDEDTHEVELRGIVEKDVGRFTFDFNPIVEKVVKGQNLSSGWGLQYSAAVVYRLSERYRPRLDFFGDFGPIQDFRPRSEQQHLVSPALEINLGRQFRVQAGAAFGLTDATEQRLVRIRLEKEFY